MAAPFRSSSPSGGPATSDGVRFHAFAHDIAGRKNAEAALRKSQEDFRMLFERHPHPMWVYDVQTLRFVEVNEAALLHYGYSRDEFLSMTIAQIRPPEDVAKLDEYLSARREDLEESGSWRHLTKDGQLIDVDIASHRLVFNGRGCVLVMAQDVSERRRLEDQLRHQALHDASHGTAQSLTAARAGRAAPGRGPPRAGAHGRVLRRPRQLQGGQRLLRPHRRR